jgi:hypothetical protein
MRPSKSTERSNIATDREGNGNELFPQAGLDHPNQIESIQEILVRPQPFFSLGVEVPGAMARRIDAIHARRANQQTPISIA